MRLSENVPRPEEANVNFTRMLKVLEDAKRPIATHVEVRRTRNGETVVEDLGCNKILDGAGLMLAQFCYNAGINGITYIAVGTGNPAWTGTPPEPDDSDTALVAEIARKQITVRRYLDGTFATVPGPAQIIEMEVTFTELEAVGEWREMGLFGDAATGTSGSGTLFSARRFKVKNKENDEQITIAWRLAF